MPYMNISTYSDMTPESRNSSLLGNGGKQVPVEIYKHSSIEELLFSMQRIVKHKNRAIVGNGVFCSVRAK
jgi:hypothetical protein